MPETCTIFRLTIVLPDFGPYYFVGLLQSSVLQCSTLEPVCLLRLGGSLYFYYVSSDKLPVKFKT